MTRGSDSPIGEVKIAKNGYSYTRVINSWKLTHHLVAEASLGRMINSSQERVTFIDKDRSNLDPNNIRVVPKKNGKVARIAALKKKIMLLQEELEDLES